MGLDVSAYSKLRPSDKDPEGIHYDQVVHISPAVLEWTEEHWKGRSEGVSPGVYEFDKEYKFHAGSYGGYGDWRHGLAKLIGFPSANHVWKTDQKPAFYELINFADNEGFIGPIVARKLATDFKDWSEKAEKHSDETGPYSFIELYCHWQKAFEIASDNGVVDFH